MDEWEQFVGGSGLAILLLWTWGFDQGKEKRRCSNKQKCLQALNDKSQILIRAAKKAGMDDQVFVRGSWYVYTVLYHFIITLGTLAYSFGACNYSFEALNKYQ